MPNIEKVEDLHFYESDKCLQFVTDELGIKTIVFYASNKHCNIKKWAKQFHS